MRRKDGLDFPRASGSWTRPDAYLQALASKRNYRRARREPQRSEPERPRLMLSTFPFLALFAMLAILTVAIVFLAFPGNQPQQRARHAAAAERGVASRGWFQEAQKEMRR